MSNQNTLSGLSTAIRTSFSNLDKQINKSDEYTKPEFTIKIANTLEEREMVFQLAYQIYLEKGFIKKNFSEWLIQNYDIKNETVILIVLDKNQKLAGSLTLVFSEDGELPAEKIYNQEISNLKLHSKKLVEISRLVVGHQYRNSKDVLCLLINYLMIYSFHVKEYSSLVIQVNPRHILYYKVLLNFDEIGGLKSCPSVQNAPAVLLHLPLDRYQSEINRWNNLNSLTKKERSLYPYFLKPAQEKLVAHYLQRQFKQMSAEEKLYFGFSESGIIRAVCV